MLIVTQEQVDLVSKLLALNVIIQRQFTTLRGLLVDVWVVKSILTKKTGFWRLLNMKWEVKLYVGGTIFTESVIATNMSNARVTAQARNPTAKIISVTASFKD